MGSVSRCLFTGSSRPNHTNLHPAGQSQPLNFALPEAQTTRAMCQANMIAAGLTAGGLVQPTPREWTLETDGDTLG